MVLSGVLENTDTKLPQLVRLQHKSDGGISLGGPQASETISKNGNEFGHWQSLNCPETFTIAILTAFYHDAKPLVDGFGEILTTFITLEDLAQLRQQHLQLRISQAKSVFIRTETIKTLVSGSQKLQEKSGNLNGTIKYVNIRQSLDSISARISLISSASCSSVMESFRVRRDILTLVNLSILSINLLTPTRRKY